MNKKIGFLIFGIVVGALGLFIVNKVGFTVKERPKLINTMLEMDKVRGLLSDYKTACGNYPTSIVSYENLSEKVKNKNCVEDAQKGNFSDKWGNLYIYKSDENGFRLLSAGPDWIEATNSKETERVEKAE